MHGFRLGQGLAGLSGVGFDHLQSSAFENHLGIDAFRRTRSRHRCRRLRTHDLRPRRFRPRLFACGRFLALARLFLAHLRQVHFALARSQLAGIRRHCRVSGDERVRVVPGNGQALRQSLLACLLGSALTAMTVATSSTPAALLLAFARSRRLAVARARPLGLLGAGRALLLGALLVGSALAARASIALWLSARALIGAAFAALLVAPLVAAGPVAPMVALFTAAALALLGPALALRMLAARFAHRAHGCIVGRCRGGIGFSGL